MNEENFVIIQRFDIIDRIWKNEVIPQSEIPEPNWVFQSQVAHVSEVVEYFIQQFVNDKFIEEQEPDNYNGVEFQ